MNYCGHRLPCFTNPRAINIYLFGPQATQAALQSVVGDVPDVLVQGILQ